MKIKLKYAVITLSIILVSFFFYEFFLDSKTSVKKPKENVSENKSFNSNIILDVKYVSQDKKGNKYTIDAKKGEIDLKNPDIIFLTDVNGYIELVNKDLITIQSNFGKYNTINNDTIFSKNIVVNYLDNKILGEYLELSILKNLMIISRNVTYSNTENILMADVIEMNILTKDINIFMYENQKKVKVKSKK